MGHCAFLCSRVPESQVWIVFYDPRDHCCRWCTHIRNSQASICLFTSRHGVWWILKLLLFCWCTSTIHPFFLKSKSLTLIHVLRAYSSKLTWYRSAARSRSIPVNYLVLYFLFGMTFLCAWKFHCEWVMICVGQHGQLPEHPELVRESKRINSWQIWFNQTNRFMCPIQQQKLKA